MEWWQKVLMYAAISIFLRFVFAQLKGDATPVEAPPQKDPLKVHSETRLPETSRPNRKAFLADPAQMIERSLVFMASLEDRSSLERVSGLNVSTFLVTDVNSVAKTGRFATHTFALNDLSADAFRALLLSALMNKKYSSAHLSDFLDTTAANISFGLAVLSQNTILDTTEEEAWRLLLLSKAMEVYPDYASAYDALYRYNKAVHRALELKKTRIPPRGTSTQYHRSMTAKEENTNKAAARMEKQLLALEKLNSDTDWKNYMSTSWEKFQPISLEEATRTERRKK